MTTRRPILIAGAGLAGLSAAYHLGDVPYRLVDPELEVGGLCRSVREDGFTFDWTGHLLHLRRPEMRALVGSLLPDHTWHRIDRRSGIYSHGLYTEYPFQVNTRGLPKSVVRDCVMGFAATLGGSIEVGLEPSFREWALATFGEGITRHFLFPYNEKLFLTDLDEMTADWVSWSIPKPTWEDVVRGALGINRKSFGYNPQFLYPAAAGIDWLPRALASHVRQPELGSGVERIVAAERVAELSTGERVPYGTFVSTMPIHRLIERIEGVPEDVRVAAARLRAVSVLNLNLGYDSPSPSPYQWVYFPESRFPFYRIGIYSNLAPESTPPGCSSFYVEISHRPGAGVDVPSLLDETEEALREVRMLPPGARRIVAAPIRIPVAYVIHDRHRPGSLERIRRFLFENAIVSIGRYGSWEYSAMEDALWQGRETARTLLASG